MSLRFAQKIRGTTLACYKDCGGKVQFPFSVNILSLIGGNEICFGNCLNVKFEEGPYLNELGQVPEDSIPKKFIWAHGI
jgi:hypothetical protein